MKTDQITKARDAYLGAIAAHTAKQNACSLGISRLTVAKAEHGGDSEQAREARAEWLAAEDGAYDLRIVARDAARDLCAVLDIDPGSLKDVL